MTSGQSNSVYHVTVEQRTEREAVAKARNHELLLSVKKGDGSAGFNAAETLIAALGTCILTNVNAIAEKMHLQIDGARVEFEAVRRDEPPALSRVTYRLVVDSAEPEEKLQRLHELALHWGTVTNTLIEGLRPEGTLVRELGSASVELGRSFDA